MDENNAEKSSENSAQSRVTQRVIEEEMKQSYVDYAMSVIVGRALPDVRDGLKPVHRRILYGMYDLGLFSNKAFKKSARVVGEILGKYHPHGDIAVYDALVRMTQAFSLRYPLVRGQGNFGSIDGDSAAAMRYCVTGDSLIVTEKGLQRIGNISEKEDINLKILSKDKKVNKASKWFDSGVHPTLKITTNKGYTLSGSKNHPILTLSKDEYGKPKFEWKLLDKIKKGDYAVIDRSIDSLWPKCKVDLTKYFPKKEKRTNVKILPKFFDEDLAFILGSFISEGFLSKNKIEFCNSDESWINYLEQTWKTVFPDSRLHKFKRKPSSYGKKEYFRLECHSRFTLEFLRNIGMNAFKSSNRQIPDLILQSPKEVIISFLKSYFEGDGSMSHSHKMVELSCCSKSEQLISEMQILLLRLGIDTFKRYDKYKLIWKLYIRGYRNILRFFKEVGFLSDYKNKKLEYIVYNYKKENSIFDFVPFISDYIRNKTSSNFILNNNFDRYGNMKNNYEKVSTILFQETNNNYHQLFEYFLNYNYLFDKVEQISEQGLKRVFSLKVESDCHSFISNGFISHNTEAKLQKLAEETLQDIDKETIKFVPNFDNSEKEPSVLPAKVPNLLINGSSGIAVGMATNIPPHNMGEIVDGVIKQIENPDISVDELMEYIQGPDFPTAGLICGRNGIINAYNTGRGKVVIRAKTNLEEVKGKQCIIVTEIPYMVNKAEMITQIADLVKSKIVDGISDLRDESDREGMRIIIELRKDANHEVVMNRLYQHSRLQTTFGINMLALVNNEPRILNLKRLIQHYIDHRKDIVTKRTEFDLKKAKQRAHILEGLIIALNNIDKTIKLVKESKSTENARTALISNFTLSEEQANAILEMRLQRLTSLEQEKIKNEHKELLVLISELEAILADPNKVLDIIKNELKELKEKYGDERRSQIVDIETTELNMEDLVEKENMVVTITHSGYIKRLPIDTYKQQRRGGKGVIAATTKEEDYIRDLFIANTHSYLLFFTNKGRVYWLKVYYIPEAGRQAKGKAVVNLLNLGSDERVTATVPVKRFDDRNLIMATRKGTVKKTKLKAYSNPRKGGIIAITLGEKDNLIDVRVTDGTKEIILGTKNGAAVRFKETDVRETGRSAQGVRGIRLREDDNVVGMVVADDQKNLLTITENGYGKRTKVSEYRLISRGGSGVRNIICSERNGKVVSINSVSDNEDVMFISKKGIMIRVPVTDISIIGRGTQGMRLMKMTEGDKVVAATKIIKD